MRKVMIIIALLAFAVLTSFGCVKNDPKPIIKPVRAKAVDANKNGVFDPNDLNLLYDQLDKIKTDKLLRYMQKVGIDSIEDFDTPKGRDKIESLTVKDYKVFMQGINEYNKKNSEIDKTAKAIIDAAEREEEKGFITEMALGAHVWGPIELKSGNVIKYAGIKIPVGATENRFARIVNLISNKFIAGRLIRYKTTGQKVGNANEAYIYVNKKCINEEMIKMGYAIATRNNSEQSEKWIKLEEEAKANKKGLWAYYPDQNPFADPLY